jgi:hypothetical protein
MVHRKKNKFEWIDWYCFDKQCFYLPKKFPYRKWKKEVVKKYNAYLMAGGKTHGFNRGMKARFLLFFSYFCYIIYI